MQRQMPTNPYGFWEVTTEGDVEGRSVRHLGTHKGYIDEIALALGKQAYYKLLFKQVPSLELDKPQTTRVQVALDIDSGTWDMTPAQRVDAWKEFLHARDVTVLEGQYYACVLLVQGNDPQAITKHEKEFKRQQALAKLTKEERDILGLK